MRVRVQVQRSILSSLLSRCGHEWSFWIWGLERGGGNLAQGRVQDGYGGPLVLLLSSSFFLPSSLPPSVFPPPSRWRPLTGQRLCRRNIGDGLRSGAPLLCHWSSDACLPDSQTARQPDSQPARQPASSQHSTAHPIDICTL